MWVYGHFHVPVKRQAGGVWYLNPGSVSIPKEGSWHGCMRMTEDAVTWLDLTAMSGTNCAEPGGVP